MPQPPPHACGQICSFVSHETSPVVHDSHARIVASVVFDFTMPVSCWPDNESELYFMCASLRAMDLRHSMEVPHMDSSRTPGVSSTRDSQSPLLSSPPCTWLRALWLTLSMTTWATPSSPCCAAACRLELLPSSTPSQWVWVTSIYILYGLVHSHAYALLPTRIQVI